MRKDRVWFEKAGYNLRKRRVGFEKAPYKDGMDLCITYHCINYCMDLSLYKLLYGPMHHCINYCVDLCITVYGSMYVYLHIGLLDMHIRTSMT